MRGDRNAQYMLYQQHVKAMYNLCVRMVGDRPAAEDILQEAFIKVFEGLKSFRGDCPAGLWIRRIVVNQCLNHLRRKKMLPLEAEPSGLPEIPDVVEEEPEVPVEVIQDAIRNLPDGARVVLVLHLLEGYRHRDIATMTGISESTSKSQYQRARLLLQQKLKDYATG